MTKFQGLELNPIICAGCDQPMFDERTEFEANGVL